MNFTQLQTGEHQRISSHLSIILGVNFSREESSIILYSGTTTTEMTRSLAGFKKFCVITNSLSIALILEVTPGMEVHMTGGEFNAPMLSLTGKKVADFFQNMHVQQLFLTASGVSVGAWFTYPGFSDLPVKQAIIASSNEVVLLVDSTKIN